MLRTLARSLIRIPIARKLVMRQSIGVLQSTPKFSYSSTPPYNNNSGINYV